MEKLYYLHSYTFQIDGPLQLSIFNGSNMSSQEQLELIKNKSALIQKLIQAATDNERNDQKYRIGDLEIFAENNPVNYIHFQFGKLSETQTKVFSEKKFIVDKSKTAYTSDVYIIPEKQVLATTHNTKISPHLNTIINAFKKQINEELTNLFPNNSIKFDIKSIPDPKGFLQSIDSAERVSKLSLVVLKSNHFDVDKMLIEPLNLATDEFLASEIKVEIKGNDMEKHRIKEVTRSNASHGLEVSAVIHTDSSDLRGKKISLSKENDLQIFIPEDVDKEVAAKKINEIYNTIRQNPNDNV